LSWTTILLDPQQINVVCSLSPRLLHGRHGGAVRLTSSFLATRSRRYAARLRALTRCIGLASRKDTSFPASCYITCTIPGRVRRGCPIPAGYVVFKARRTRLSSFKQLTFPRRFGSGKDTDRRPSARKFTMVKDIDRVGRLAEIRSSSSTSRCTRERFSAELLERAAGAGAIEWFRGRARSYPPPATSSGGWCR